MDIALFIPVHNRPHCLKRLLHWLKGSNLPIYIGDSSYDDNAYIVNDSELQSLSIKYFHKSDWNIYDKWNYVTSRIKEKYTVTCAEDDFPLWQNFQHFYDQAELSQAGCVVGRELTAFNHNNCIVIEESQEYRKWCIHNTNDQLLNFQKANNPIVCTFYQFFRTDTLCRVHSHWASLKSFYPGNKMQEIIFRSSTFILCKVVFENTILNVRTDEPTLRYSETTVEAKKFRLNFVDELKALRANNRLESFLTAHSHLIYSSMRWNVSKKQALDIVTFCVWKPMLSRMVTKHEILWKSRVKLLVSPNVQTSEIIYNKDGILWQLPLSRGSFDFKEPGVFANLESFVFRKKPSIANCMKIAEILLAGRSR